MEDLIGKIICDDCFNIFPKICDNSIDLILCDLPYKKTKCHWDILLPVDKLWEQYIRIIKEHGAIILTSAQPFTSFLVSSNLKMFRYELIWRKNIPTGFLDARRKPLNLHESILIFSKKRTKYNPQMIVGKPYIATSGGCSNSVTSDENIKKGGYVTENKGTRFPVSVLEFKKDQGCHPTQKPVKLFEYLIKTYTDENELVLDNCAGSFTTAIAAINTKRQWICIEKELEYCNVAFNRFTNNYIDYPIGQWR